MRNRWEARWDLFQGAEREKNPGRLGSVARKASQVSEDKWAGGRRGEDESLAGEYKDLLKICGKVPATCSTSSGWWFDFMCARMH